MRKADFYLILSAGLLGLMLFLVFIVPAFPNGHRQRIEKEARLVEQLGLTDLCLFTEARYTRHLSQADRFSPFQDFPGSIEHFPSGSIVAPPAHLTGHTLK